MSSSMREYLGFSTPVTQDSEIIPVEIVPAVSPADAFSEHVAMVRRQGDAVDALDMSIVSAFKSKYVYPASLAGAETVMLLPDVPLVAVLGTVALSTTGPLLQSRRQHKNVKNYETLKNQSAITATGQQYKLYRVKDKKQHKNNVMMRWYGVAPNEMEDDTEITEQEQLSNLLKVAELAKVGDVKAVLLADEQLPERLQAATRAVVPEISVRTMMHNTKNLDIRMKIGKKKFNPMLYVFTPEQLSAMVRQNGAESQTDTNLDTAIELVRLQNPSHPIIVSYDRYKQLPELLPMKLKSSARKSLERRLDEVAVSRNFDTTEPGSPNKRKIHLTAAVRDSRVHWTQNGKQHASAELLPAVAMSQEQVQDIIAKPTEYPIKDVAVALECAAYLQLAGADHETTSVEKVMSARPNALLQQGMLQLSNTAHGTTILRYANETDNQEVKLISDDVPIKLGLKLAILAGLGAMVATGIYVADTNHKESIKASETAYAAKLHINRHDLTVQQRKKADAAVVADNPIAADYFKTQKFIKDSALSLQNLVPPGNGVGGEPGFLSDFAINHGLVMRGGISKDAIGSTGVGNVPENGDVHHSEWQLAPSGGMSTVGYWAIDTGVTYTDDGTWLSPDVTKAQAGGSQFTLPLRLSDPTQSNIHVSRQLTGDETATVQNLQDNNGPEKYIRIPVLRGLVPAAADYDGRPVSLLARENGTYEIVMPQPEGTVPFPDHKLLSYDLVRANDLSVPHAVGPNIIQSDISNGIDTGVQRLAVRKVWSQAVPDVTSTRVTGATADTRYVRDNFTYSYTPLPIRDQDKLQQKKLSPSQLVAEEFQLKSADCNLAGTVVALDNTELNPVWGWHNNKDDQLQDHEAHLWDVNAAGTIYDATPTRPDPNDSLPPRSPHEKLPIGFGIGGLVMAGVYGAEVYRRRRHPVRAQRRLARTSASELVRAKSVADMAAYRETFDVSKLRDDNSTDHAAALAALGQHQVHSQHVAQSLEAAAKKASRADRKLLRQSQQIIRTVQRAGYAQDIEHADDVVSMLS